MSFSFTIYDSCRMMVPKNRNHAGEPPMLPYPHQNVIYDLGVHRVIEPKGALPQPAWRLDNTPTAYPTETLVDVHALHIDSASFTQIASICDHDQQRMSKHILDIVAQRGKMHNPVT